MNLQPAKRKIYVAFEILYDLYTFEIELLLNRPITVITTAHAVHSHATNAMKTLSICTV